MIEGSCSSGGHAFRNGFNAQRCGGHSRRRAGWWRAAVQDGFDLYLHGFIVSDDGRWTIVQQGMNGERKQARRYHWLSQPSKRPAPVTLRSSSLCHRGGHLYRL
jgi:hypothetical protein